MAFSPKEEEDEDFGSDVWLRNSVEMLSPKKEEKEDEDFGSDAWLRNSVEMKDEEEYKPDLSSVTNKVKTERDENHLSRKLPTKIKKQGNELAKSATKGKPAVHSEKSDKSKSQFEVRRQRLKDIVESAPVTEEVGNLCRYGCPKCDKEYETREGLKLHSSLTKHLAIPKGSVAMWCKYLTKVAVHKCSICLKKVLCEKNQLLSHIKIHKISTLKNYLDTTKSNQARYESWSLEVVPDETTRNKLLWERTIGNATLSEKVGNLCQFRCIICGKIYYSKASFQYHLREIHKTKYSDFKFESLLETTVHKCLICLKSVLCDKRELQEHMKHNHKTTLEQYMSSTGVKEIVKKKQQKTPQDQLKEFCQLKSSSCVFSNNVENLCSYSCNICDFKSSYWQKMRVHITAKHHNKISHHSKHITRATFHKCVMCGKILLCDKSFIGYHLYKKHKMNMKTYTKKSKMKSLEDGKVEYFEKLNAAISKIPSVPVKPHHTLEAASIPDNLVTGDVGNISIFKCLLCNESSMCFSSLRFHCQKQHKQEQKFASFNSAAVAKARYHKCHICAKIILCDNTFVGKHTRNWHKLCFEEYKKDFVLKRGHKAYPVFKEFFSDKSILDPFLNHTAAGKDKVNNEPDMISPNMISSESEDSE